MCECKNEIKVKIKREDKRAILPEYAHNGDACMDLRVLVGEYGIGQIMPLLPKKSFIFDTGLKFDIPEGHVMKIFPRSGLGIKHKVVLSNLTAIIDENFKQTVKISLTNNGDEVFYVNHNDRVAQFQIVPYPKMIIEEVDEIEDTGRGEGIGSSGVK